VFTLVKAIQTQEIIFINDLKVIIQKMQYIRGLKRKEEEKVATINAEIESLYSQEKTTQLSRLTMIDNYVEQEVQFRMQQAMHYIESPYSTENAKTIHDNLIKEVDREVIGKIVDQDIQHIKEKMQSLEKEQTEAHDTIQELARQRDKLEIDKVTALKTAITYREAYLELNKLYDADLKIDREKQQGTWRLCNWCKT